LALADELAETACPTVTRQLINPSCSKDCDAGDCRFVTTIQNPCGCPAAVPTASLLEPCNAECPYGGCDIVFRTTKLPCPTTTTTSPRPTTSTSTSTSTSSTSTSTTRPIITTSITTLPPRPTTTPCPTVTRHTQPGGCDPIRCPVPTCVFRETVSLPCGCAEPKTVLYIEGCSTACPEGCLTRTTTVSATAC
ncbi:hypothetical protein BR93DRAFT_869515, partial [Coniochaeta sp. PMI_546]